MSLQHARVSIRKRWICVDNCTSRHTETGVAGQINISIHLICDRVRCFLFAMFVAGGRGNGVCVCVCVCVCVVLWCVCVCVCVCVCLRARVLFHFILYVILSTMLKKKKMNGHEIPGLQKTKNSLSLSLSLPSEFAWKGRNSSRS